MTIRMIGNVRVLVLVATVVLAAGLSPRASAGDLATDRTHHWHQWRGPEATGVAPLGDPPEKWDDKTNVRWKAAIPGKGNSTPIVWGQQVFVLTAVDTGRVVSDATKPEDQPMRQFGIKFPNTLYRFAVLCFDLQTGKLLWEQTAVEELPHEGHHGDNSFATASPTTDGQRLYVSFGSRGIFCYDLAGHLLWRRNLGNVSTRLSFGEASSPVIHGEALILNRDNEGQSHLLVLDAKSGETKWKAERDEVSAWATPLVVEHKGQTQVITNASNRVRSYRLDNGEILWQCGGQVSNVTPSPVCRNDVVYCMSGYRGSAAVAIPLDATGDVTGTDKVAWRYDRDTPYVPSPLLVGDRLYFTKSNSGILTCLTALTGQPVFEASRLPGITNVYASPVAAADRIYIVDRNGTTVVIKRGPQLEVLTTNKLSEPIDASPAIVGKKLLLRGHKVLYCLEAS